MSAAEPAAGMSTKISMMDGSVLMTKASIVPVGQNMMMAVMSGRVEMMGEKNQAKNM